jgi:antibiotic biosynthesis monooxygenase (ABM) superfamily enzyme
MSQSQNVLNDPSVTVVISRRVKPECKAEFELFLLGLTTALVP